MKFAGRGVAEQAVGVQGRGCRGSVPTPARRSTGRRRGRCHRQYPWGIHRQGGVLGRAVGIVGRGRGVVGGGDRERHCGRVRSQGAVAGPIGEGVGAVVVGRRGVGERAVGVQGQGAVARPRPPAPRSAGRRRGRCRCPTPLGRPRSGRCPRPCCRHRRPRPGRR